MMGKEQDPMDFTVRRREGVRYIGAWVPGIELTPALAHLLGEARTEKGEPLNEDDVLVCAAHIAHYGQG